MRKWVMAGAALAVIAGCGTAKADPNRMPGEGEPLSQVMEALLTNLNGSTYNHAGQLVFTVGSDNYTVVAIDTFPRPPIDRLFTRAGESLAYSPDRKVAVLLTDLNGDLQPGVAAATQALGRVN